MAVKKAIARLERNLELSRSLLEQSQDVATQSYYAYRVETIHACIELLQDLQREARELLESMKEHGETMVTGEENE